MIKISSKDNQVFKYLKKLSLKKYRDQAKEYLVFGKDFIDEAIKTKTLLYVFTCDENTVDATYFFESGLFNIIQNSSDHKIGALVKMNNEIDFTLSNKILVLDSVQDPANVGMLLRSALAFGFSTIVASKGCADYYNEKTIKASKGSLFHLNLLNRNLDSFLNIAKDLGYDLYFADTKQGSFSNNNKNKSILLLGNEGNGISQQLLTIPHNKIHINTLKVESLNVAIAGAIIMYEMSK